MNEMLTELAPPLQRLVDARLDNIERALLSTDSSRSERRQILAAVEDQIQELISRLDSHEPTRADILKLLASIDPPEAYGWGYNESPSEHEPAAKRPRTEVSPARAHPQSKTNVLAIVAICLGGLSLAVLVTVCVAGLLSFIASFALCLPAFILGIIALCQIVSTRENQKGIGLAITGISSLPAALFIMAMIYVMLE